MEDELSLVVFNASLYCIWALYFVRKYGITIATFPMLLWAGASLANIYYFTSDLKFHTLHDRITLIPYLYLFALVCVSFIPLIKFDYKSIRVIEVNSKLFSYVSFFFIFFSLIGFIPNLKYLLTHSIDATSFLEAYEDKASGALQILTGLPHHSMQIIRRMRGLIPILMMMSFTSSVKVGAWIKYGLVISQLGLFIDYLNRAERFGLITDLFMLTFLFFMLYPFINEKIRKKVTLFGGFILVVIVGSIVMITISRFGENEADNYIWYNLSLYFGESFSNFNGDLWNMSSFTDGLNCFKYIINRFFMEGDATRNVDLLESITHRRMYVFYTFVGDFFIDFGPIGAAFIVIGSSFVFIKLTEVSSITSFSKILLICLYTKVLLMGYTYWSYLTAPLEPVVAIVLSILFNISLPPKKIES